MKKRARKPDGGLTTLLGGVDWARVAHLGGEFIRHMRGDSEVEICADANRVLEHGRKLRGFALDTLRNAAGCTRSPLCTCIVCQEHQYTRPGVDQRN